MIIVAVGCALIGLALIGLGLWIGLIWTTLTTESDQYAERAGHE